MGRATKEMNTQNRPALVLCACVIGLVTVPGAVAGWEALHRRFGKLPLATVLAPAVRIAREGFPVSAVIARGWAGNLRAFKADGEAIQGAEWIGQLYAPGGGLHGLALPPGEAAPEPFEGAEADAGEEDVGEDRGHQMVGERHADAHRAEGFAEKGEGHQEQARADIRLGPDGQDIGKGAAGEGDFAREILRVGAAGKRRRCLNEAGLCCPVAKLL